MGASS